MPINSAVPTDTMISASVSMLDSHSPSSPIAKNPTAATMAMRQPASTPAIAAAPAITPSLRHPVQDRSIDAVEQCVR